MKKDRAGVVTGGFGQVIRGNRIAHRWIFNSGGNMNIKRQMVVSFGLLSWFACASFAAAPLIKNGACPVGYCGFR